MAKKSNTVLRISVRARDMLKEISKVRELPMSSIMQILIEQEHEKVVKGK